MNNWNKRIRSTVRLGDLVYIPLSNNEDPEYAVVDAEDIELISFGNWCQHNMGYAKGQMNGKPVLMHNLITGYKGVDHRNGDKLDNRRSNLRPGPHRLNSVNKDLPPNSSGYRGVCYYKKNGTWQAQITVNRKQQHLGRYATREEAAEVYNKRAFEVWGDYARLNIIEGGDN